MQASQGAGEAARGERSGSSDLKLACFQKEELVELRRELTTVQAQVAELQVRRQAWQQFKKVGSVEHQQRIQKLQSDPD